MPTSGNLEHFDDLPESPQGPTASEAGGNDEIRPAAFLRIGDLVGEDAVEPGIRHPGPGEHPGALHEGRGGDHHDRIAKRIEPDLEQQRDVEDHQRRAAACGSPQEAVPGAAHQRVGDRFQPAQRSAVFEDDPAQRGPVYGAVPQDAGKGGRDRGHRGAAARKQAVHHLVGIMDRQTHAAQHGRGSGLAHADRAGQAEDHHRGTPHKGRSATRWARSASSTSGSRPNQPAKPGRA